MIRIDDVKPLEPHWLRLWFSDGSVHEVDVGPLLARGGVFEALSTDAQLFNRVRVEPGFGTVEWPGPLDLDPDVLHGDHLPSGCEALPRRVVRGPSAGQPA
jgi:hypothetical protein